jgi:hypothetical protein
MDFLATCTGYKHVEWSAGNSKKQAASSSDLCACNRRLPAKMDALVLVWLHVMCV